MDRQVHLHLEGVPNPNAIKFVLENGILTDKPYEFTSIKEAEVSPLARKILMLRYVDRVLINRNHITILKSHQQSPEWDKILMELRFIIQDHLKKNEPILFLGSTPLNHRRSDDVIAQMVTDLLNAHIRPAAQEDGGDIVFESYQNGVLNLSMHGACHKCPYVLQTIREGVEPLLTQQIPEIQKVTAIKNEVI
ncbi:MAG: NifU family protein [Bacteroidia bacterium]